MKAITFLPGLAALLITAGVSPILHAADAPDPAPPPGAPSREALREQFKNLTPEERQVKMKEMREKLGQSGPGGAEFEKRRAETEKMRQELQSLPPAERAARIQAWRQTNGFTNTLSRPAPPGLNPEDSAAKRKQFQERIDSELTRLKAKKADGSITEEETRRLDRMTEWSKRLESAPAGGPPALQRRPSIDEQLPKPVEPAKPAKPSAPPPAPAAK